MIVFYDFRVFLLAIGFLGSLVHNRVSQGLWLGSVELGPPRYVDGGASTSRDRDSAILKLASA